jgi:hypothetical protein
VIMRNLHQREIGKLSVNLSEAHAHLLTTYPQCAKWRPAR